MVKKTITLTVHTNLTDAEIEKCTDCLIVELYGRCVELEVNNVRVQQ